MKRMGFVVLIAVAVCMPVKQPCSFAQDKVTKEVLSAQITEAKTPAQLYTLFTAVKDLYTLDSDYSGCVSFLSALGKKKKSLEPFVNYFTGLTRYEQLKYLEEKQLWDEYFSLGNTYRQEISDSLQKVVDTLQAKDPLAVYSRLILWQYHTDQQDVFHEDALDALMSTVREYAQVSPESGVLRLVAERLTGYGEKAKAREVFKFYVDTIATASVKTEDLNASARDFYQQGNRELAELVFDVYCGRVKTEPKEKAFLLLSDVAQLFSVKSTGLSDPAYAEKIFAMMEAVAGQEAFDEGMLYLRSLNLEKSKEYKGAKASYGALLERFPQTVHRDEAEYKIGLIQAYVDGDSPAAQAQFSKIVEKQGASVYALASRYHLGLLAQWAGETEKANGYYTQVIEQAGEGAEDIAARAQERLKEISEGQPIEYNLKTYLDIALSKNDAAEFPMARVETAVSTYNATKGQDVTITAHAAIPATGCMQVSLQYLWSGMTGTSAVSQDTEALTVAYPATGTKEVFLVVVSPTGIIDRSIELIDVY